MCDEWVGFTKGQGSSPTPYPTFRDMMSLPVILFLPRCLK